MLIAKKIIGGGKSRQSNIELCRIASIILVLFVHSAFAANGYPSELDKSTLWLISLESFSIIGVNVFIFISGYFSIKLKPRTIYTIVLTVAFYFLLLTVFSLAMGEPIESKNLLFISNSHYFIIDYIGLALLSPILNKFAESASKKEFGIVLLSLVIYQVYFACITGVAGSEFDLGYSLMSFSIIYLIARYIKLYGVAEIFLKYSGTMYLVCTLSLIVASILLIEFGFSGSLSRVYAYNNPIVIASSVFFFLFFKKWQIADNMYINHMAKSTLGVLLIHASKPAFPIWNVYKQWYCNLVGDITFVSICYWILSVIIVYLLATFIDQIRIFLLDRILRTNK